MGKHKQGRKKMLVFSTYYKNKLVFFILSNHKQKEGEDFHVNKTKKVNEELLNVQAEEEPDNRKGKKVF
jgi:hypothetical protein